MALFNQSDLPELFSPWKVNLKSPISSGLQQAGIALGYWFHQIFF
jgi:hypothetical protein